MILVRVGVVAFACLAAFPLLAKERVLLTSGFQLEAQSHTEQEHTLVFQTVTGTLELPVAAVARIEAVVDEPAHMAVPPLTSALESDAPERLLANAALAQGLPPELVRSVARIESGLHQEAVSVKGARGLMQLMPETAVDLGVDASSAKDNAEGGAKYLRSLLLHYRGDAVLALAAYNAGPAAVAKFGGVPPYSETRHYVERVLRELAREQKAARKISPELRASNRLSNPSATK